MSWLKPFCRSSIGGKFLMAVTGLLLFGFLIGHLSGNLLVFQGPEAMNEYAAWLHDHPGLLWSARLGLLAVVGLHIGVAARMSLQNRSARPAAYATKQNLVSTPAARSMLLTGLTVAAYVVYHLAHFTWGRLQPDLYGRLDSAGRTDVFFMVTEGFQSKPVVICYLAALAVLGLHLWHGVTSFFQTLGLHHSRYNSLFRALGSIAAAAITLGYAAIPIASLSGALGGGH